MTCYVDTTRHYPEAGLRSTEFCHLLADTREELHAMADAIGMPREYFQEHAYRWHYDLPPILRTRAVNAGAVEVSIHEVGRMLVGRRRDSDTTHTA